MAGRALRVLAVAHKPDANPTDAEEGLTLLGLAGLIDPPRPEARPPSRRAGKPASRS